MDKTFYTYEGWKRKLKSLGGSTYIEGDKDIAQGFVNGVNVGEWDGAEGVIFYDRLDRLSKTHFVRQNPKNNMDEFDFVAQGYYDGTWKDISKHVNYEQAVRKIRFLKQGNEHVALRVIKRPVTQFETVMLSANELEAIRYAIDRTLRWMQKGSLEGLSVKEAEKMTEHLSDAFGKVDL